MFSLITVAFIFEGNKLSFSTEGLTMNQTTFWIEGMTCQHCRQTVQRALSSLEGVQQVEVSLSDKKAVLLHSSPLDPATAVQAVEQAGFKAGLLS